MIDHLSKEYKIILLTKNIYVDYYKNNLNENLKERINYLKSNFPILVSISNKSFLGKLLEKEDPADRNTGTAIAEMLSIINGASIIRTHNPKITSDVIKMTKLLTKKSKKGL